MLSSVACLPVPYFPTLSHKHKLRIHNITAKAALKFGSEAWVLKKREEQRRSSTDEIFKTPSWNNKSR